MTDVLPGVEVRVSAEAIPAGTPTDTGRLFAVGVTERGPLQPTVVTGVGGFRRLFGAAAYDSLATPLQAFWAASDGAGEAVVARVVGPAAAVSDVTVSDGTADTITFEAAWPGAAGDDLEVVVAADGTGVFRLTVNYDDEPVETWRGLTSVDDAVQALQGSQWIRAVNEAAGDGNPANGSYDLTGGTDDRANIVDASWQAALNRIAADYGPGQLVAPGRTSSDGRAQLVDHAEATNRIAFVDGAEGDGKAELLAVAAAADSRQAAVFGPWLQVRVDGRVRTVPASVVAAGVCARIDVDAPTGHTGPDRGRAGLPSRFVSVGRTFDDADAAELNGKGVNLFRSVRGQVLLRGFRTSSGSAEFVQLSKARYVMSLSARLNQIADGYVFRSLTRETIADYGADLAGELLGDQQAGALFDDPAVDVGPDVNPAEQVEQGILRARVQVAPSPTAERIVIDLIKTRLSS